MAARNEIQAKRRSVKRASSARVDLSPRARPTQQRAQDTLDLILDTAANLLDEGGAEGLTTKKLAERAEVRIRTVYRYFPNKLAVICALAERVTKRQRLTLQAATRQNGPETPWRTALHGELNALVKSFDSEPGLGAIRRAMQASPALREIDARANEEIAQLWEEDLRSRGMSGSRSHRLRVARTAVEMSAALLDPIERDPSSDRDGRLREFRVALESYLANYLD